MKVTKRNGSTEDFNVEKIKQVIEWACEGVDVNPLALEAKFDQFLVDGISTKQLQANLISHAKNMATPDEPDWVLVAGRLETMDRWADTRSYDVDFIEFFKEQVGLGYWAHPGFSKYSDEDVIELGECIVKENDLNHSIASVITAKSKYLLPNECIQHMFMGNAMVIASVEDDDKRVAFAKEVYNALSERKISLATPWLSNLRNNGNISSCFIMSIDDNIHSIFDNLKRAALVSKNGGGLGVDVARVRARGSSLMGCEGGSGGIGGWIKLLNDVAVSVNQGGKRAGAITVQVPIWHGDIDEYLDIQTEAGDQRKKAYDIKTQVGVHDYFMELKNDPTATWYTFCPYEVKEKLGIELYACFDKEFEPAYLACAEAYKTGKLKVVRSFNAKQLWIKVLKVMFETGMPYTGFLDEINRQNPNKHIGNIPCVNLCTESFSVVVPDELMHTCNLASLVVGRIGLDEMQHYASLTTHILDNGIALTSSPVVESDKHNKLLRTIGVGVQGYADLIAREGKSFLNIEFASDLLENIQYGCVKESVRLAKERGKYPAYAGSEWDNGNKMKAYKEKGKLDWEALEDQMSLYGIRNSQMTSPAPNTSTSIFMDAAAGIMPVYSAFFYEENRDGIVPVTSMYLKENPISYSKDVTKFKPWELPAVVGAMQYWVDTGISAEYVMDKNQEGFSAKWLWDTLENAWKSKNKAVYYIRTLKQGERLVKDEGCVACAG